MSVLQTVAESLKGLGLSVFGGWLVVVCVGGLLTLGVLSALHWGILLSVGAIGLLLGIGGCCILHRVITASPTAETEKPHRLADVPVRRSSPTSTVRHQREVTSLFDEAEREEEAERVSSRPRSFKK